MERIRQINPVLPDLVISQIVLMILGETIILLLLPNKLEISIGYAVGIIYVIFSFINITLVLEKAMYYEERGATVRTVSGYFLRFILLIVIEIIMYYLLGLNAVFAVLIAMLSMKVSAYLQPLTHKVIKKLNRKGGD